MIKLMFQCDGCLAEAEGKSPSSEFISFSGRSYGFGSRHESPIRELSPDGWIAFDPYTGCTYCPECWKSIEDSTTEIDTEARSKTPELSPGG